MQININYDQSVSTLPSGFVSAINYVVDFYESIFTNPVSINFDVGFGEVDGQALGADAIGESIPVFYYPTSYSSLITALENSGDSAASLPASDPGTESTYYISTSEAGVLGLEYNSGYDAYLGFNSILPLDYSTGDGAVAGEYDFVSTVEHEFSEAMGRDLYAPDGTDGDASPLDLFRYSSPGVLTPLTSVESYFSLDRGVTDLRNFYNLIDGQGDVFDWAITGTDAFNAMAPPDTQEYISPVDIEEMDALGYSTPSVVVGTGSNFAGNGEYDVFLRASTGQLVNWQYDSSGNLIGGLAFTLQGVSATIDSATTILGTATNILGTGGHDVIGRTDTGQVFVWEANGNGSILATSSLSYQGVAETADSTATVLGTTTNFLGLGGTDIFGQSGTGQVFVWEVVDSDVVSVVNYENIGVGFNFAGYGGNDVFLRNSAGQVSYAEFSNSGALLSAETLTFYGGGPITFDSTSSVVGFGQNLSGIGGHDMFWRNSAGQLVDWEFNSAGAIVPGLPNFVTQDGKTPFTIGATTTVMGSGQNFTGTYDGHDVFLRNGNGQVSYAEFNDDGTLQISALLTFYGGAALAFDTASSVVGVGQDLSGNGGHDLFWRTSAGQLIDWEFNNAGTLISGLPNFVMQDGQTPFTIDATTTVMGSGQNFTDTYEGHDVFLRNGNGQLSYAEFNDDGTLLISAPLTFYGGAALAFDTASSVVGIGQDLSGNGGHDLFWRTSAGQLIDWEFNNAGTLISGLPNFVMQNGQTPFTIDVTTAVIGSGQNFSGLGGHDVFLRNGSGQISYAEFNNGGTLLTGAPLSFYGGATLMFDTASSVVGVGQDLVGEGGNDMFWRTAAGQLIDWEFNRTGTLVGGLPNLRNADGTPFTIDTGTTVIGTDRNALGHGGFDVGLNYGNGQTGWAEFNGSGILLARS